MPHIRFFPKADKEQTSQDVRFVPKVDSCGAEGALLGNLGGASEQGRELPVRQQMGCAA